MQPAIGTEIICAHPAAYQTHDKVCNLRVDAISSSEVFQLFEGEARELAPPPRHHFGVKILAKGM
jgi:hypothetical protein